ncbi:hypothetical protein KY360_02735 [Candidatus Woesearchaeota archaeon]|nr:hypothetical protein [Candidatus Woesearchaeota archaeon]
MDYAESDREHLESTLAAATSPVLAYYRTGSTVNGQALPHSDIDYIIINDMDTHTPYGHVARVWDPNAAKFVDFVHFTRKDLESPSTIPDEQGRDGKIKYLMRELVRERILLHGGDAFLALLNEGDLKRVAEQLGIDSSSMARLKNAVSWE